jgi:hypothetical protein
MHCRRGGAEIIGQQQILESVFPGGIYFRGRSIIGDGRIKGVGPDGKEIRQSSERSSGTAFAVCLKELGHANAWPI